MTRDEALIGLHKGEKWTHNDWDKDEWIRYDQYGHLVDQCGRKFHFDGLSAGGWKPYVQPPKLYTRVAAMQQAGPEGKIKHHPSGQIVQCKDEFIACHASLYDWELAVVWSVES